MKGIIILAHGSKNRRTENEVNKIIEKLSKIKENNYVTSAYLQFSENDLMSAVIRVVDNGIRSIKIVPMFLFSGVHITRDIPEEIERIKRKLNGIDILLTKHIGTDEKIVDIILDKIDE